MSNFFRNKSVTTVCCSFRLGRRNFATLGLLRHVTSPMRYFDTRATPFHPPKMRHFAKKRHFANMNRLLKIIDEISLFYEVALFCRSDVFWREDLAKWPFFFDEVTHFRGMKRSGPCVEVTLVWRSDAYSNGNYFTSSYKIRKATLRN